MYRDSLAPTVVQQTCRRRMQLGCLCSCPSSSLCVSRVHCHICRVDGMCAWVRCHQFWRAAQTFRFSFLCLRLSYHDTPFTLWLWVCGFVMVEEDLNPQFFTLTQMIVVILHVFCSLGYACPLLSLAQVCRECQELFCAPSFQHDGHMRTRFMGTRCRFQNTPVTGACLYGASFAAAIWL